MFFFSKAEFSVATAAFLRVKYAVLGVVLYCVVLCGIVLYCIVLYCSMLCCVVLCYQVVGCAVLQEYQK